MISVDIDKLQVISQNIKEQADNLETEKNKIIDNVKKLNNCWEGEDAIKYTRAILEVYSPNIDELIRTLRAYGDYLTKASEAYVKLDAKYASRTISV